MLISHTFVVYRYCTPFVHMEVIKSEKGEISYVILCYITDKILYKFDKKKIIIGTYLVDDVFT